MFNALTSNIPIINRNNTNIMKPFLKALIFILYLPIFKIN